jgi:hypothetical protein
MRERSVWKFFQEYKRIDRRAAAQVNRPVIVRQWLGHELFAYARSIFELTSWVAVGGR